MTTRPYLIRRIGEAGKPRLVDAPNPSTALRHVAQATFTVKAATGAEVAEAIRAGVQLEVAGEEPATPPTGGAPVPPPAAPAPPQAPAAAATANTTAPPQPIAPPDANAEAAAALEAALDDPAAGELALQREEDAPEPPPADAWVRDNDSTYDNAILMIDEEWTGFGQDDNANLARIASWSDDEVRDVEAFCAAVIQLGGGDPATLPVRPAVIGGPLPIRKPAPVEPPL